MKVAFCQVYVEEGAEFGFSVVCQRYLTQTASSLVERSQLFTNRFGADYDVVFFISAKKQLLSTDVVGPSVDKRGQKVEYSIFLPYDVLSEEPDPHRAAIQAVLQASLYTLADLGIDTSRFETQSPSIVDYVGSVPQMIRPGWQD